MLPRSTSPTPARRLPHRRTGQALAILLITLGAASAGCSAGSSVHPQAPTVAQAARQTACKQPPAGSLPGSSGALTQDDSGVFCLAPGHRIDVFLTHSGTPAAKAARWSEISSSNPLVVAPVGSGMLTPPVGVTPGIFRGAAAGTARLSSRLPDGRTWQVTIAVR